MTPSSHHLGRRELKCCGVTGAAVSAPWGPKGQYLCSDLEAPGAVCCAAPDSKAPECLWEEVEQEARGCGQDRHSNVTLSDSNPGETNPFPSVQLQRHPSPRSEPYRQPTARARTTALCVEQHGGDTTVCSRNANLSSLKEFHECLKYLTKTQFGGEYFDLIKIHSFTYPEL